MKKAVCSLAICFLFVFYLPANGTATPTPNKIISNTAERYDGTFEVFVLQNDQWHQIGTLEYRKHLREKHIGLNGILPAEENAKWGNPEFTCTDKGNFQRKIYNFAIPLETLSIEQSNFKRFWQSTNKSAGGQR